MTPELLDRLLKLKGLSAAMSEQVPSQSMVGTAALIREEVDAILRDFGPAKQVAEEPAKR